MSKLVTVTSSIWYYLMCGVGMVVVVKMFKRPLSKAYNIVYAKLVAGIPKGYNKKLGHRKEKLFTDMFKMVKELNRPLEVLEIGAGSGANFAYFPKGTNVTCVDPNPYFSSYLDQAAKDYPDINIREFLICRAEDLSPVLNNSVDAVVCTLVLCSVTDVGQSLQEFKRVLRPGGKLFYLEHVRADEKTFNYKLQRVLNPAWKAISDGCNLTRDTWRYVDDAGFSHVKQERFLVEIRSIWKRIFFPSIIRPHVIGVATK